MFFTDFTKIDTEQYYFDIVAADGAVKFIETFCHHSVGEWAAKLDEKGKPRDTRIKLEDWQKDRIIRPAFGWKSKTTGLRMIKTIYLEIPKKNSKTTLAAAIINLMAYVDKEPGSQIYLASASSKEQAANLLLEPIRAMIDNSPILTKAARIYGTEKNTKSILVTRPNGTDCIIKCLTAASDAAEGIQPQVGAADETHVFKHGGVIENITKSMVFRRQPLMLYTTTAGDSLTGVGWELSKYYEDVAKGIIDDPSALVAIFRATKDDDPFSEKTWAKVNPMYGITIKKERLEEAATKARNSAASMNKFKRYHLNMWVNTLDGWIEDEDWMKGQAPINWEDLHGMDCYGGLDLSSTRDTTAFSLVFRKDNIYYTLNRFFLPEEKTTEEVSSTRAYPQWVKDGAITETDGDVVDYDYVRAEINQLAELYNIKGIYYDPYNSHQIIPKMVEEDGFNCIVHRQGAISMNTPMKFLEVLIAKGRFQHDGNPVLRWMMGNVKVKFDEMGNFKIAQKDKHKEKIDGVVSNVMAISGWVDEPEEEGTYLTDSEMIFI